MTLRTLDLGRVTLVGAGARFVPAAKELAFDGAPGERAQVALRYAFEEASPQEEHARFALLVELPGQKPPVGDALLRDQPGRDDKVQGAVVVPVTFPASGEARGTFQIDVYYARGPWTALSDLKGMFREKGGFVLRVRT